MLKSSFFLCYYVIMSPVLCFHRRLTEKRWCCYGATWSWNTWVWNWGLHWNYAIILRGWNKANCKRSQGRPVPARPMSNKPWRSQHADTDSWGTQGLHATSDSTSRNWQMLQLHADFQSGESVPCVADTLPHPLIIEQKAVQSLSDAIWLSEIPKEKNPCSVYIA